MIKPWLSKNFLHQMTWSSVRDYPPKVKKAWLFDNFIEMEETHSDHMKKPWEDPGLPLPPSPDIPQTEEDVDPDPCTGDRTLWVEPSPSSSIDCDEGVDVTFLFSPDYKCIDIQQLFFDEDGPKLVDSLGNNLAHPTNIEDLPPGGLTLKRGCDDADSITLVASDCLCGGYASANIFLDNCGANCAGLSISGASTVGPNGTAQYTLNNAQGTVTWAFANLTFGSGFSINSETGLLTMSGACGWCLIKATDECCGIYYFKIKCTAGIWSLISSWSSSNCCPSESDQEDVTCYKQDNTYKYVELYKCIPGDAECLESSYCTPEPTPPTGKQCTPSGGCGPENRIVRQHFYIWTCS